MDYMLLKSGAVEAVTTEHLAEAIPAVLAHYGGIGYYYQDKTGAWHGKMVGERPSIGCATIPTEDVPEVIRLAAMLE